MSIIPSDIRELVVVVMIVMSLITILKANSNKDQHNHDQFLLVIMSIIPSDIRELVVVVMIVMSLITYLKLIAIILKFCGALSYVLTNNLQIIYL